MYEKGQRLSVTRYNTSSIYEDNPKPTKSYDALYESETDRYYIFKVCKTGTWEPIYTQTEPKVDERTGNLQIRLVL